MASSLSLRHRRPNVWEEGICSSIVETHSRIGAQQQWLGGCLYGSSSSGRSQRLPFGSPTAANLASTQCPRSTRIDEHCWGRSAKELGLDPIPL
jgi:hypothetical protein